MGHPESRLIVRRRLYDVYYLCHPWTWWRISQIKRINVSDLLICSVLAILPGMVNRQYALSPISLAFGYRSFVHVSNLWKGLCEILKLRSNALPEARLLLEGRIAERSAYRRPRYDVYLPPISSSNSSSHNASFQNTGVMILPGAYVEHASYATISTLLTEKGYFVVVVSAEPLRLTDPRLPGFTRQMLSCIQRTVSREHNIHHWELVGHSMGSFAVTKLYKVLNANNIVLWASAPYYEYMDDISNASIRTLVVQGSNDFLIAKFGTPERNKEYWKRLPSDVTVKTIQDGTHCGFASYQPLNPEPGMDVREQQKRVVELTVEFWKQTSSSGR